MSTSLIRSTYDFIILPSWKNFRSRTFCFLIYTEWKQYKDVFVRLKNLDFTYLAIGPVHDMDFKSDGKPDKPHHHCLIRFKNARSSHQFARDCLLTCKVEPLEKSFRGAIRYMVHADDPDKFQYSPADIYSTNYDLTMSCFNDLRTLKNSDDADEIMFLQDLRYLIKVHSFESELDIALYCVENGYGAFFRRYKYQIHSDYVTSRYEVRNKNKSEKEF